MKTQSFLPTTLAINPLWSVVRFNGFHKWICWWCWFGNCNNSVNSMIPLSLLTKGVQTIRKIVQTIENSVHTFTSFGNFMKNQHYFWLRRRWIICSQIVTFQNLIWISGNIVHWQNFNRWTDLIHDWQKFVRWTDWISNKWNSVMYSWISNKRKCNRCSCWNQSNIISNPSSHVPLRSRQLTMPRDCQSLHESYHKKHNLQLYRIYHRKHKLHKLNHYSHVYIYTLHKF